MISNTKKVLFDSSIIIDTLRKPEGKDSLILPYITNGWHQNISIITKAEIYSGSSYWNKPPIRQFTENILSGMITIDITDTIALKAGNIRHLFKIDLADSIIAATSLIHEIPLYTLNTKHFSKIPKLVLL